MNYYAARQRESDKRWDYTCMNDKVVWPIGYCRPYKDLEGDPWVGQMVNPEYLEKARSFAHKHHDTGHATAEEAQACYREYQLDQHLDLHRKHLDTQFKCLICGEYTEEFAEVDHTTFVLCEKHNSREEVEKLFTVTESVSSW